MNRSKKMIMNSSVGVIKQLVFIICGFILPRYMLMYYGSSVNGLVSSITHFLSFISLMEMGISPVIQSNLYKPLAEKNEKQISVIIKATEKFFRNIAFVFLIYIGILFYIFPKYINTEFNVFFSGSLLLIIAISTFAQYFFGMTYQVFLNADQKSYVQLWLQIITVIFNTLFSVILIINGASIHLVKLITAIIYLLRPFGQMLYVKKHYKIDSSIKITGEPIKQKWNGFSQHLAMVVSGNIDVALLSFFSSLANVSIYSIYFNVTSGVTNTVMAGATGLEAMFGNMIAKKENDTLKRTFSIVECISHYAITIVFAATIVLIVPFVRVYTRGIDDVNYIVPVFGVLLSLAYYSQCLRIPYFRIIKAAGCFKETQNGAFIATIINVVISFLVVFRFGLIGVSLGTLVAMIYHTLYFVIYLKKNILYRPLFIFARFMISDFVVCAILIILSKQISLTPDNYLTWSLYALVTLVVTIIISTIVFLVLNYSTFIMTLKYIKTKLAKKV